MDIGTYDYGRLSLKCAPLVALIVAGVVAVRSKYTRQPDDGMVSFNIVLFLRYFPPSPAPSVALSPQSRGGLTRDHRPHIRTISLY